MNNCLKQPLSPRDAELSEAFLAVAGTDDDEGQERINHFLALLDKAMEFPPLIPRTPAKNSVGKDETP